MIYQDTIEAVGNTPLMRINTDLNINLYAKYEGVNPTGSVKDRAANYLLNKLLASGEINKDTTIIESSSGNFGVALATYCKKNNLKSTIVIDPNILPINEFIIRSLSDKVVKVTERDETGGFLLTRIRYIKEVLMNNDNYYWANQYGNPYIAEAYQYTIGKEICDDLKVDYAFLGVSSGGTIAGISTTIKERYPNAKIIAVDTCGSVIFGGMPKKRFIPGIGSSMKPDIIEKAHIDDVVMVDEKNAVKTCVSFLQNQGMLLGGSSGSVYYAVNQYFKKKTLSNKPNVVIIFADRGDRYSNTIYNEAWNLEHFNNKEESKFAIYK